MKLILNYGLLVSLLQIKPADLGYFLDSGGFFNKMQCFIFTVHNTYIFNLKALHINRIIFKVVKC